VPHPSPPTEQDQPSSKRRGRTRRGRRGGRKSRRSERAADSPAGPAGSEETASAELDIGIVFAERSEPAARRAPQIDVEATSSLDEEARKDVPARLTESAPSAPSAPSDATEGPASALPEAEARRRMPRARAGNGSRFSRRPRSRSPPRRPPPAHSPRRSRSGESRPRSPVPRRATLERRRRRSRPASWSSNRPWRSHARRRSRSAPS